MMYRCLVLMRKINIKNLNGCCQYTSKPVEIKMKGQHLFRYYQSIDQEIRSILWSALDVKHMWQEGTLPTNILHGKRILFLTTEECVVSIPPAVLVAETLGAHFSKVVLPDWDKKVPANDIGYIISSHHDLVLCKTNMHYQARALADSCTIPCCYMSSKRYVPFLCLMYVLTVYEHFGRMRGVKSALVGAPTALTNTFLLAASAFGMNIKILCNTDPGLLITPYAYETATTIAAGAQFIPTIENISCANETFKDADLIVHSGSDLGEGLDFEHLGNMNERWVFLTNVPRKNTEVLADYIHQENCLIWRAFENAKFIMAAILIRAFTDDFGHITEKPTF